MSAFVVKINKNDIAKTANMAKTLLKVAFRTPVYVSDAMSDGWHDLIFPAHGGEEGTGFRVFHYQDSVGYQNANMEFMDDMDENFCGRRIIADNFIDDMDKGNYLTLREPPLSGN